MSKLPAPGPDVPPQTVLLDAGQLWGKYLITFFAKRNPRQGMRNFWFWTMQSGKRLRLARETGSTMIRKSAGLPLQLVAAQRLRVGLLGSMRG